MRTLILFRTTKLKVIDFLRFDSKIASVILLCSYLALYYYYRCTNNPHKALLLAGKIFRHVNFEWTRNLSATLLQTHIQLYGRNGVARGLQSLLSISPDTVSRLRASILNLRRPFDRRLIILSPPNQNGKGVLLVKFTEYFKYLPCIFDLNSLSTDYVLTLEPSFSGYFDEDILCLLGYNIPIVIQAPEPPDYALLASLNANIFPVDLGSNCWVDSRTFYPIHGLRKEYDIIMVSIWADFKRHYHLFESLSKARSRHKIRVALVGTPWPKSLHEIRDLAKYYGVDHCIEFFENISQQELNILLNKSRAYLLLSRREGCNKSMIEAMFADVPVFLLSGFNYGYSYPYINSKTGAFIQPSKLTAFIESLHHIMETTSFSPREWVSAHMSVTVSIEKLTDVLRRVERELNIKINKELQLKINNPDCDYMDHTLWDRYAIYYRDLQRHFK